MSAWTVDFWVLLSLAAAGFQTLRFALQKVLSTRSLTPTGATFARFVYSAPIVAVGMATYLLWTGQSFPSLSPAFWGFAMLGGFAQVMATVFVVTLFKSRNFAVGVTLMKTEVILSVVVGLILLNETVDLLAFGAILMGLIGVLLLSTPPEIRGWGWSEMANRSVALGLGAGLLFAVSAVCYRGASLEIASTDAVVRAGLTLSAVTAMQMVGMALWLRLRDAEQLLAVWQARRVAIWIGLMSLAGSFCWFWAFTLQTAAYVKAVGQVELIFSLVVSALLFSERSSLRELAGMTVLSLSILILVLVI